MGPTCLLVGSWTLSVKHERETEQPKTEFCTLFIAHVAVSLSAAKGVSHITYLV
jgi:hypothetical protein